MIKETYMNIAELISAHSNCIRRQVGAIAVRKNMIISTGTNSSPNGHPDCKVCERQKRHIPSGQQLEICRAVHAEMNLIINALQNQVSLEGADVYCTHAPCDICARMLCNTGIKRFFYSRDYPGYQAGELFSLSNIELVKL